MLLWDFAIVLPPYRKTLQLVIYENQYFPVTNSAYCIINVHSII